MVQSELEAMLEMGVIEESHSGWASPIVLIPKTDVSVCFCVDYRKVNAVSGGVPSLSRAVGQCGVGGVVQRDLQWERGLGDEW